MKPILSTEEVRRLEDIIEREGTSKAELMEHAGEFVAAVAQEYDPKEVVVLTGFGNNGGDGWVAADILQQRGVHVTVATPVGPSEVPSALARHVARRTSGRDVEVVVGPSRDELADLLSGADLVIDAILGTGFHGQLRPPSPSGSPRSTKLPPASSPSTSPPAWTPRPASSRTAACAPTRRRP